MELKKEQREPVVKDIAAPKKKGVSYVEEIKTELRNVTWTSKDELIAYTKIVVGSTFVLGLGVYFVDLGIQSVLNTLTWLTRITVG